MFLDLSKVEFADFVCLGDLLLLVDRAVTDHVPCTVALPSLSATQGELRHNTPERVAVAVRRRTRARMFLEHSGFTNSLSADHWPTGAVQLLDRVPDEDSSSPLAFRPVDHRRESDPFTLAKIFPFTWLTPMTGPALRQNERFLSFVLSRLKEQVGLLTEDAESIAHAVFTELVENVAEHAGAPNMAPPRALVGAMRIDGRNYAAHADEQPEELREFIRQTAVHGSDALRIVVGDSGVGLLTRLQTVMGGRGESTTRSYGFHDDLRFDEQAAFFAFDRWSTSGPASRGYERGSRGLNRIERLVRSYGGFVTVRSERAHVGHVMLDPGEGTRSILEGTYRSPGTRLEVTVVPQTSPMLSRSRVADVTGAELPRLRVTRIEVDIAKGVSQAQRTAVDNAARDCARDPSTLGLVVLGRTRAGSRSLSNPDTLDLLRLAAATSGTSAPVALVLPDADDRILRLAVDDLQAEIERSGREHWDSPYAPTVVIDGMGRSTWFGTSRSVAAVLSALESADDGMTMAELEALYVAVDGELPDRFLLSLRDHHALVEHSNPVRLRMTRAAIGIAVEGALRAQLSEALETSGVQGVHRGAFRTPTLRRTALWIEVERLLDTTVGVTPVGFALARMAERTLHGHPGANWVVARAAGAPSSLAESVKDRLGLPAPVVDLPNELDLTADHPGRVFANQTPVIVVTDLIATENTVRRSMAHVVGLGGNPRIILTVLDGRSGARRPIRLLGRTVPVRSLARAKLRQPLDDRDLQPIDPVLRRPMRGGKVDSADAELFLGWCVDVPQSLALGHLVGASGSHFTVYPLIDRLLSDARVAADIVDRVVAAAGLDASTNTVIIVPESDFGYARKLGELVALRLGELSGMQPTIHGVIRVRGGSRWAFPAGLPYQVQDKQVLILDWGAMTARTMQHLVRLAADAGAGSIRAVVLISELDPDDEAALTQIAQVHGRRVRVRSGEELDLWSAEDESEPTLVDTHVAFVTFAALHGFSPVECPSCASRQQYERLATKSLSELVRTHGAKIAASLTPLPRSHMRMVGADPAGELVPVSEAADFLRWRHLLDLALRSTAARQEVVDRVKSARAVAPYGRSALLRLLAAEAHWLKLPPLRFEESREALVSVCRDACQRFSTEPTPVSVQRLAVVVLAQSNPELFVKTLPDLYHVLREQHELVSELFAQFERILQRPSFDSPVDAATLETAVADLTAAVESNDPLTHDRRHRIALAAIALHVGSSSQPASDDAQEVWSFLRRTWLKQVAEHSLEARWEHILTELDTLAEMPPEYSLENRNDVLTSLREGAAHLFEVALSRGDNEAVRVVLLSQHFRDRLGDEASERIDRAFKGGGKSEFASLIHDVEELYNTKQAVNSPSWEHDHKRVVDQITWWMDHFVSARIDGRLRAHLPRFLEEMPTDFFSVLDRVFDNADWAYSQAPTRGTSVFLPPDLLTDVLRHVRANAERSHYDGIGHVRFLVAARRRDDALNVAFANTASMRSAEIGSGMQSLNSRLAPFGAALKAGDPPGDGEWTYSVTLSMQIWRGN